MVTHVVCRRPPNFMSSEVQKYLERAKGLSPGALADWNIQDLCNSGFDIALRMLRGLSLKSRIVCEGIPLCGRGVRITHGRHIRAGNRLNLEDGCEIVGLSKHGVVFGERCTVGRSAVIRPSNVLFDEAGEGLEVGDHPNLGAWAYVGCSGFVKIGTNVMMGPRVSLLAENHNHGRVDIPMKKQGVTRLRIVVEDDCWLGASSSLLAGVTIGKGSVVAAGAVVTKDVPPYAIVAGVPAKVIRIRHAPDKSPRGREQ